jgi:hypothetical protein
MSTISKKLLESASEARRKTLRRSLDLYRVLKGHKRSTEYDWGCDYPRMVRPDHKNTLYVTFTEDVRIR